MSMSDPLGDMLTRIRNGQMAKAERVTVPFSRLLTGVLKVLEREGYIRDCTVKGERKGIKTVSVRLKYRGGQPVIKEIKRVSKPGRRVYAGVKTMPRAYGGLGVFVLSTPSGIITDRESLSLRVGGEVLCRLF